MAVPNRAGLGLEGNTLSLYLGLSMGDSFIRATATDYLVIRLAGELHRARRCVYLIVSIPSLH